jgi:hypothetical protein
MRAKRLRPHAAPSRFSIAADPYCVNIAWRLLVPLLDLHLDNADFLKVKTISCVFHRKYGFHHTPGHDDLIRTGRKYLS